jgi:hypothetical protein
MNMKVITVVTTFLVALFIVSCDDVISTSYIKKFDYSLQGTWVSNDTYLYSGSLIIDYDRITIKGYNESQTKPGKDDNARPFKGFTKNVPLKSYSEEGKIFIEDGGLLQEGIPYTYWEDDSYPDYKNLKFISFTFSGRVEKLEKQ